MSDNKVKRYDCTNGGYAYCAGCYTMREEEYGEYVEWEDYEALLYKQTSTTDVQGELVAWMRFEYRHPKNGKTLAVRLSREEVAEYMDEELFQKLVKSICDCAPVGETYAFDCRCDEFADEFELVDDQIDLGASGLVEALDHAATSLETLSKASGREDHGLAAMTEVRGYANSRARVAREALESYRDQLTDHPSKSVNAETEKECRLERDIVSESEKLMELYEHNKALVKALERISGMDSMSYYSLDSAMIVARNALSVYREQGGET